MVSDPRLAREPESLGVNSAAFGLNLILLPKRKAGAVGFSCLGCSSAGKSSLLPMDTLLLVLFGAVGWWVAGIWAPASDPSLSPCSLVISPWPSCRLMDPLFCLFCDAPEAALGSCCPK